MILAQTAVRATIKTNIILPWSTPPIGLSSVLEEKSKKIAVKEKNQNGLSWFKAHSTRYHDKAQASRGNIYDWKNINRLKNTRHKAFYL